MKSEIRILGIDDAPFSFSDKTTDILGVVMRGNGYMEAVLHDHIQIDGNDATSICEQMITRTRHYAQLKAVLFDGATMGGFNILDIESIWKNTKIPVITVTRNQPDFIKIRLALKSHFSDWEKRIKLLEEGKMEKISTYYNPIYIKFKGITFTKAKEIITLSTIRGVIPEPLRVAHIIASGISRGESYGKA
jgi:uncharacterized protein